MIRRQERDTLIHFGIPRESGDDPWQNALVWTLNQYSPRERG